VKGKRASLHDINTSQLHREGTHSFQV